MMPRIFGAHPLAKDGNGRPKSRIGTVFPFDNTIVTVPGIHATQRDYYYDWLNRERIARGEPPLTLEERRGLWDRAVDLIMEDDRILIRPDPDNMPLMFAADEVLSRLVSIRQVRFLNVRNAKVREAIKRRGQCWRISPLPKTPDEMIRMIESSRIGIEGREIYCYNPVTGTRFLTCEGFAFLAALEPPELRQHLLELQEYSARVNRYGTPEIVFFLADGAFTKHDFAGYEFRTMGPEALRTAHGMLCERFARSIPPELRVDDPKNVEWRNRMYGALIGRQDEVISEEVMLGLASEFYMQIEWRPGGWFEEGEFIPDPYFDEPAEPNAAGEQERRWDEKSRGFIFNFIRQFGDLEYVNVGRVIGSLSSRQGARGRRDVYVAEIKIRGSDQEIVRILRMQKWGVRERLDEGKNLLQAMIESEDYTEYVLDRRLGCRQLGMNLTPRLTSWRINETYLGHQWDHRGIPISSPYFERDYISGIASEKIHSYRFKEPDFALAFARLMGRAAAPNLIVGRCDLNRRVVFDDGDEVIQENEHGVLRDIVVTDQMGTFRDYTSPLEHFAAEYAGPINRRIPSVPDPKAFAAAYLESFLERLSWIQQEYFRRKRAFDTLFCHRRWDEKGSFRYRWEQVLKRLQRTDPRELTELIRKNITLD